MTRQLHSDQRVGKRELRSPREIGLMRKAGLLVWKAHQAAGRLIRPGVTTREIDAAIEKVFADAGATPLFLNYPGKTPFPAVTCISVNEEIVHGIPGDRKLVEGDIVSVDTGCRLNGWCGDAAITHAVGEVAAICKKLLSATHDVLNLAIELCESKKSWAPLSREMQRFIESKGFSIVQELVGHGIGKELHESPSVPNYFDEEHEDFTLRPGVVIAIEPMINIGKRQTKTLDDHWTIVTRDGKPSAHFEHTVAITSDGAKRLTGPPTDEELEELDFDPGPKEDWIVW